VKRLAPPSLILVGLLVLAACTAPSDPEPTPTPTVVETAPSVPEPAAPALVPGGSADDNLPFFASVVDGVWAGPEPMSGRAYIDALVAAGFDRAAMQVTADESTVGNAAESIQFSVRWGDRCLVGQIGPATGDPVATVLPGLADGGCLVGATRPIDW
jgi:hypothetical protein